MSLALFFLSLIGTTSSGVGSPLSPLLKASSSPPSVQVSIDEVQPCCGGEFRGWSHLSESLGVVRHFHLGDSWCVNWWIVADSGLHFVGVGLRLSSFWGIRQAQSVSNLRDYLDIGVASTSARFYGGCLHSCIVWRSSNQMMGCRTSDYSDVFPSSEGDVGPAG